jgi:signal transduction histidine kinase
MAEGIAGEMPVRLKLDLGAPSCVEIDPARLRRALGNVLDNAVQALAETGDRARPPRIMLRTRLKGGKVEIDIADNGPGIAPETLARAFEPLFSTRRFGTGLGLATTRQVVEQHGGTIELASRVGKGTRARIYLPLADAIAAPGNPGMPAAA